MAIGKNISFTDVLFSYLKAITSEKQILQIKAKCKMYFLHLKKIFLSCVY